MKIIADKNIPYVEEAFSQFGEVIKIPGREITSNEVREADMLLVRTVTTVDETLLDGSKIRFVGSATIGFDHVDLSYLKKNKIGFSSAAGCNANSVGEYVTAALLALSLRHDFTLSDKTIGIIGAGNTGSNVAAKARALGLKVLLNDPPLADKTNDPLYSSFDDVIQESDILTFHVPLSETGPYATYHMGNDRLFDSLNKATFLINSSRGPVIQTEALLNALESGKILGAVIDVWENEPCISSELLEKVDIGTPHIAGYSRDGKSNATLLIYQAACSYFDKAATWKPDNLPKPEHLYIHIDSGIAENEMKSLDEVNVSIVKNLNREGRYRKLKDILAEIVQMGYDIYKDDKALRMIMELPHERRGPWFEQLRNNYQVRREFHSRKIIGSNIDENLINTLRGLGFCHEPEMIVTG